MIHIYRCPECGSEIEREQSIKESPAEIIEVPHAFWPTYEEEQYHTSYLPVSCSSPILRRVWQAPCLNLGYREHLHNKNEQFRFKNL